MKVQALIRKVLYLKNWNGNIFGYLKNAGNPLPLNLLELSSSAKTEYAPMSNEAIIVLHEDVSKGVTL